MDQIQQSRSANWQSLMEQVQSAYQALDGAEKQWISAQLTQIAQLQRQLDQLFLQGGGATACQGCQGGCCAKGHNHMTLANLLGYLQQEQLPPHPDFTRTCPFLGEQGCLLPVERRPYPCISFVCDIIEDLLPPAAVRRFYQLEQRLRQHYQAFAERYTGGGMTGLLLQYQRLCGAPFLQRKMLSTTAQAVAGVLNDDEIKF